MPNNTTPSSHKLVISSIKIEKCQAKATQIKRLENESMNADVSDATITSSFIAQSATPSALLQSLAISTVVATTSALPASWSGPSRSLDAQSIARGSRTFAGPPSTVSSLSLWTLKSLSLFRVYCRGCSSCGVVSRQ